MLHYVTKKPIAPPFAGKFDGADTAQRCVFANGCWDLLHCGHFNAFRQARELAARFHDDTNANGDPPNDPEAKNGESAQQSPAPLGASRRAVQLVVGLHSNDTVLREKGKQCVMTDAERGELLRACAMVDEVVPDVPYSHITPELLDAHGPSPIHLSVY